MDGYYFLDQVEDFARFPTEMAEISPSPVVCSVAIQIVVLRQVKKTEITSSIFVRPARQKATVALPRGQRLTSAPPHLILWLAVSEPTAAQQSNIGTQAF